MKMILSCKKVISAILGVALIVAMFAGCTPSAPSAPSTPTPSTPDTPAAPSAPDAAEKKHVVLKMASKSSSATPIAEAIRKWCELVNAEDTGLELQAFPDSQLGTEQEMLEQALMGENICMLTDPTLIEAYSPQLSIINGPYFVPQIEDFLILNETAWFKEQIGKLKESNLLCVNSHFLFGQRHVVAKKAVRTPADLAGQKIRAQASEVSIAVVEAMGATAIPLAFGEIYTALAQGTVDGAENPLATIYSSKHHENAKVISLTGHMSTLSLFIMNNDFFNSLSGEQQKVFLECGEKAADYYNNELNPAAEADSLEQFEKEGVTIVKDVDIPAFLEATKGVYELIDKWGAYETAQSQMAALKS